MLKKIITDIDITIAFRRPAWAAETDTTNYAPITANPIQAIDTENLRIINVAPTSAPNGASKKAYVDAAIAASITGLQAVSAAPSAALAAQLQSEKNVINMGISFWKRGSTPSPQGLGWSLGFVISNKDSIILLRDLLTNPLPGAAKFVRWSESNTRKDFLARPGCREAYLPELHERVVDAVTGLWSQAQGLRYSVTIELQRWLREARGALSAGGVA